MTENSGTSVAERPWLFKKGRSGNPGGRPRDAFDFAAAARKYAPEYLQVLLRSLKSDNWRERHSALSLLMDRAFGKPTQQIASEDGSPITLLHLCAVREVGERIIAELVARQSSSATIDGQSMNGGTGSSDGTAVEVPAGLIDLSVPALE
jgi:hypothetical protein